MLRVIIVVFAAVAALVGAQSVMTAANFVFSIPNTAIDAVTSAGAAAGSLHGTATLQRLVANAGGSVSGVFNIEGSFTVGGGSAQTFATVTTQPVTFTSTGAITLKRQVTCQVVNIVIPDGASLTVLGRQIQIPSGLTFTIGNPVGMLGQLLCTLANTSILGTLGSVRTELINLINSLLAAL